MEFTLTARMQGQAEDYTPLAENQLEARLEQLNGDGSAANPIAVRLSIRALADFCGVVRVGMKVQKEADFYLPGVIYGTNRGDAPLLADSNCPRLRLQGDFPASPWWMFRADRLSHP